MISFPGGSSIPEGGRIAVRFDADGDTTVTRFRYAVDGAHPTSEVPVGPDGTASVLVDVGWPGEHTVHAIAVNGDDRLSGLSVARFTVSVVWDLRGWALDATTFLPVSGATIRLEPGGGEVVTGADGYFQFDVEPGLHTLSGLHAGPPSLSGSQELLLDGQGVTFDLYLFPDSGSRGVG
ncbi:hypothetical protein CA850_22890 [Micromonospora echinospora]|uniref:hypothetical protein n=1 Tax=Micromonospora echinospora TaxID=1877 RepID=UPI000B5AEDED|nr:hypothetical protein [Micromonospora echinospora]OZV77527.1 hypothetical protein CA850_22890 [Micromonospora echinospora]